MLLNKAGHIKNAVLNISDRSEKHSNAVAIFIDNDNNILSFRNIFLDEITKGEKNLVSNEVLSGHGSN